MTIEQVEAFLMGLHGGNQRFTGHFEEVALEATGQCHWPFHQAGDLLQQIIVDDDRGVQFGTLCFHQPPYQRLALLVIDQHLGRAQGRLVVRCCRHGDRRRVHEPMAARLTAGGDSQDPGRNHF